MSYDIYLTIDTGGKEPATVSEIGNYTSNVTPMWSLALGFPLKDLDGRLASDCIPHLERAVEDMRQNPLVYRRLNPPNGWGTYEGALRYLESFLGACRKHPKTTVYMSY